MLCPGVTLFRMSEHPTNSLANASSAYLRSAMHQPTQWHEWGPEAFALAQEQNKPILLDIGAVWCHWCHVMDRESYESPEVANILTEHYIAEFNNKFTAYSFRGRRARCRWN